MDNPDPMPTAVPGAMIPRVTPVKEFMRTAAEDTELHGKTIKAGDAVLLSYVSANRDEDAFDDPFAFNIEREPNKHLAFGHGLHFCPRRTAGPDGDRGLLHQNCSASTTSNSPGSRN